MRLPRLPRYILQVIFLVLVVALLIVVVLNELPWFFLLLLLIVLILLLWWLFSGELEPSLIYPPEKFYVQDEIIIRGPQDAVDAAVSQAAVRVDRKERIAFGDLNEVVKKCLNDCSDIDFNTFVIDLYDLSGADEDVAAAIQAINAAVGRGSDVRAEPNWLSGYPWEPTGSPWEPTGSPWEPTGSSDGKANSAPPELYMKQWAFKQIGLDQKKDQSSGRKVRIGVFDTSPFGENLTSPQSLAWVKEPGPLTVGVTNYPTPENEDSAVDLSNHGLFSAGMAHALAKNADIQILRVLNENNFGDMYSLIWAIYQFIVDNAPGNAPEGQLGAVINMSLGIRVPPDKAGFPLPLEVQSLRDILQAARCANIVVVAAAGNNSANLKSPEPSHLPGNWSEIIGVAASDQEMGRACFSNRGNIAAPGGDGRTKADDPNSCEPANDSCGVSDCKFAVVGPVLKESNNTGYAYWSGTSFACPMVAGLAACVIEKGQGQLSPDQVRRIIECGATPVEDKDLGVGIINVPNTLDGFLECLEKLGISIDLKEPRYGDEKQVAA